MRPILVTGASGFIGRYTCSELQRLGLEFAGIDQRQTANTFACDLTDSGAISALFRSHRFETVIHLAGILPTAASADPALATRVNILGSMSLLEAAIAVGCRRFIFGSSMSVYGLFGLDHPIGEDQPAAPCDVYGSAKRLVEIVGEKFHLDGAIEFAALRIATVVGPGARNTSSPWRSEIFEMLGTGSRQTISLPYCDGDPLTLVHVEDAARILVTMAQSRSLKSCVYNTPAELWRARDLKRVVEGLNPNLDVVLSGRRRVLAPLADGRKFVEEFRFEMPSVHDRLRKHVSAPTKSALASPEGYSAR